MKSLSITVATIVLSCSSTQIYAEDYDFKPGLWERTTTMEVIGAPVEMKAMMGSQPKTDQECINETEGMFPSNNECKIQKSRVSAKKMLLDIECTTSKGLSRGTGEINFSGETISGWTEVTQPHDPSGQMKVKNIFTAKYLGACG